MARTEPKINSKLQWGKEFLPKAVQSIADWGRTDLYSTGDPVIDEYLGCGVVGGYGRKDNYEIITIFGDTGMNKSTFATSMILDPAKKGVRIGYFALEDDPLDVARRIYIQCEKNEQEAQKIIQSLWFLPENAGYTLSQMAELVKETFKVCDIVVIDPIQFIFEASVEESGQTEFNRQRLFMREMNTIMKSIGKTLILVSHTSKSGGRNGAQGLDRIIGSSSIAQVSTKVIEINRKDGIPGIRLWKTRFTPFRHSGIAIALKDMRVVYKYHPVSPTEMRQLRSNWDGKATFEDAYKGAI